MPDISLVQLHHSSPAEARRVAQKAADELARDYDLASVWDADTLRFHRTGIKGTLQVTQEAFVLQLELGFLLRPFKSAIEDSITGQLDTLLPPAGAASNPPQPIPDEGKGRGQTDESHGQRGRNAKPAKAAVSSSSKPKSVVQSASTAATKIAPKKRTP